MSRIMKYEMKRLLFNKFFIGLCVINGLFAWYTLTSDTVAGVAHTAPFSPWSFSAYLAASMPVSVLTVLFLLTFSHSQKEKQVGALTTATPVDAVRYSLIRLAVVAFGFFFLCVLVIGISIIFYAVFFDYRNYPAFILPAIIVILPCFVFILGVGNFLGRIHPGFLYILMFLSVTMNFIPLPRELDFIGFFGSGFYASFPLKLPIGPDGEPAFTLSAKFLTVRAIYLAAGAVLPAVGFVRAKRLMQGMKHRPPKH